MVNTNFSTAGLNALQHLDQDRNGVSVNELKNIDRNQDHQISEAEAAQAGFEPQDTELLNRAMQAGHANPNVSILMDTAQVHGWEEISMELINDSAGSYQSASRFSAHYRNRELDDTGRLTLLAERLGNDFKPIESFVHSLNDKQLLNHSHIESLVKRVGAQRTAQIGAKIVNYLNTEGSRLTANERKELIKDLIKEAAVPASVTQGGKGTCAACAVQMKLAIENPVAYTEMALKLAEGHSVKSPGGDTIEPNDTWRLPGVKYGDKNNQTANDHRSLSSKALQNAFMNEALYWSSYESNEDYENNEDAPNIGQQAKLLTKVFGEQSYDPDYWASGSAKTAYLEDEIARGRSAVANFNGHAILVVGFDKSGEQDKVIFWSDDIQYQMDAKQFAKDVVSIVTVDDKGSDNRKIPDGKRRMTGPDLHAHEQEVNDYYKALRTQREAENPE